MVRDNLVKAFPVAKAKFFVIWVPMLGYENHDQAVKQSDIFEDDDRFTYYWDEKKTIPNFLGSKMELPNNRKQAWDIYLLYDKDAVWGKEPPKPTFWMHQLGRDERYLDPARLKKAFGSMIDPKHEIVLLTRDGCPGTPIMRANLEDALRKKGLPESFSVLDLGEIDQDDVLTAYGTPTVLVDGKDLMGAPSPIAPGSPT